jgi:hypothetical protein
MEDNILKFYRAAFDSEDVMAAYKKFLAKELSVFHSERMLMIILTKYIRNYCMGRKAKDRREDILTRVLAMGLPNTLANRQYVRRFARRGIRPSQALIDHYARRFLIGKSIPISVEKLMSYAKQIPTSIRVEASG